MKVTFQLCYKLGMRNGTTLKRWVGKIKIFNIPQCVAPYLNGAWLVQHAFLIVWHPESHSREELVGFARAHLRTTVAWIGPRVC
jgi:hypothetical protein